MFFIINIRGLNMKKYIVTLTKDERETLSALTSKGKHNSQKILNALILLGCDEGEYQKKPSTNEEIAHILNISMRKIDRVFAGLSVGMYHLCIDSPFRPT